MSIVNELLQGVSKLTTYAEKVTKDILLLKFTVVNACIFGDTKEKADYRVLIDTGLPNSAEFIKKTFEDLFGKGSQPKAIILTHGHFDHVGSVSELAKFWDIPVYAHEMELPYIKGQKDYPKGDPTVDEGLVAKMSPAFPNKSLNLGLHAVPLPADGSIPAMPGWKWIHTPGHTEGHVSLFRESDRVLIAGDAFTTTKQESLSSVLTQREEVKGPPAYLTTDWKAAEASVKRLAELKPAMVIPSHGKIMTGEELPEHLQNLATYFESETVPEQGKYVE